MAILSARNIEKQKKKRRRLKKLAGKARAKAATAKAS